MASHHHDHHCCYHHHRRFSGDTEKCTGAAVKTFGNLENHQESSSTTMGSSSTNNSSYSFSHAIIKANNNTPTSCSDASGNTNCFVDEGSNLKPLDAMHIFENSSPVTLKGVRSYRRFGRRERQNSPSTRSLCSLDSPELQQRVIQNGFSSDEWLDQQRSKSGEWRKSLQGSVVAASSNSVAVKPEEFREQRQNMKKWFLNYSDEQKNLLLKDLLGMCKLPQMHLLSLSLEHSLHSDCPLNCKDWISWLPSHISLIIFSYLDPVSLCGASKVCHNWYSLTADKSLWRRLSLLQDYSLSTSRMDKILSQHASENGEILWKQVFSEQYRLKRNWLTGRCLIKTFDGHTGGISCVQFDDKRIVSGSWDTTIKVWNIKTNLARSAQTLTGHSNTVRCLHLADNRLVSGSTDCTIKVWDLASQPSWSSIACKVTLIGHTDAVRCLQVNGDRVISGSYDKTLKLWDITTGECIKTLRSHNDHVLCVQFNDEKIISGSADKTIKVWKLSGECVNTLTGHQDAVTCIQFDTQRVISGSLDCTIKFWNLNDGRCTRSIDWMAAEGHTRVVRCIQADDWRLVSGSDDKTIKVWSLKTGKRLVTLRQHKDGVTCLQFNDTQIVSGSFDRKVLLWDFNV